MITLDSLYVCSMTNNGNRRFTKSPDTPAVTASTLKMVTAYVARRWITDEMLNNTTTVIQSDLVGGSTANLQAGDVITYSDLFYGAMLPSGNDAAICLARSCGQLILTQTSTTGNPLARFITEMNDQAVKLGWTDHSIKDANGGSPQDLIRPSYMADLMRVISNTDSWLTTVMGTLSHTLTVTGPNPRSITVNHTIKPEGTVKFPEFIAGKTGTTSVACVVMLWARPDGTKQSTALMGSTESARYRELRAIMDYIIQNDTMNPVTSWIRSGDGLAPVQVNNINANTLNPTG